MITMKTIVIIPSLAILNCPIVQLYQYREHNIYRNFLFFLMEQWFERIHLAALTDNLHRSWEILLIGFTVDRLGYSLSFYKIYA